MADIVSDSFDREDGPLGSADTGQAWTLHTGAQFQVVGNQAVIGEQVNGLEVTTVDGGPLSGRRGYAQVRLAGSVPAAEKPGVCFRFSDLDNFLGLLSLSTGSYALRKWEAGEPTDDLVVFDRIPVTGDVLRVEWDAGQIAVFINGQLLGALSNTFNQHATRYGLVSDGMGTEGVFSSSAWDDFRGGTMGEPVSTLSFIGVGLENTAGTPVKSQIEIDAISETLRGQGEPIRSRALTRTRAVKKAVMGPYQSGGDLNFEVTPDKVSKLFYALFDLATTGAVDPFVHVYKTGNTLRPMSVQIKRDDWHFVYPGLYGQRLTFRAVIDQILEATLTLAGIEKEKPYDTEQSDVGIAASSADPFVFHQATAVQLASGLTSSDTNNHEISIDTGLLTNKGLGAGRAPNRAHPGESGVTGSFDFVFDSITQHRKWMGATSDASPIAVGNSLQTMALALEFIQSANRKLKIEIPKAYYTASEPAVESRNGIIMQRLQWASLYDATALSDVVLTLTNGETGVTITGLGTNI